MNWQAYWKAILSFVSTVALPAIVLWVESGQPWPTTASGWVLWAVTVFGSTTVVAAGPANKKPGKHEAA